MIDNSIFCTTVLFVGICFLTNVVLYPTITLLPSDVPFNMDDFSPIQTSSPIITGAVLGFSYSAPKFATIPCKKSETFSTAADNQTEVTIHVLQGERPMAAQNKSIGQFNLTGIAPARRGIPQIEVTFDIDANGILKVSAKDKATGKEQAIRIEASSGLSKEEIEKMKAEAEANAEADKKEREKIDKLNQADSMIFSTENQLKELGDKLSADKKAPIETALQKLKDAHKAQDLAAIDTAMAELNTAFQAASAEMYAQSGAQGGAQAGPGAGAGQQANQGSSSNNKEDIQDADFEEVK